MGILERLMNLLQTLRRNHKLFDIVKDVMPRD